MTEQRTHELVGQMHDRILSAQGASRRWAQMSKAQQQDWIDAARWLVQQLRSEARRAAA